MTRARLLILFLLGLITPAYANVTLRFICWDGDTDMPGIRNAAHSFEATHPGIIVEVESVPANYQEKLLAQVAAHVAPDVVMMDPGNFQKFATRDALLPLNQFFKDTPTFDLKGYYKNLVDAHSLNGQLYVLPRDIAPCANIYYNKNAFDEAGIPYPDGTWTWDYKVRPELREKDFLWVVQQLTKKDKNGRTTRWGYAPAWQDLLTGMFYLSTGARLANDNEHPTKLLYDDPRVIKAYQFTADLALKEGWVPSATELKSVLQQEARQTFTSGKVAMMQSGIWEVPSIRKELIEGQPGYFDWDIALAPAYKDGTRAYPTGGSGYAIISQTKHPHEAWLLTEWMAGEAGMMELARSGRAQPAIRKLALSEPWIPGPHTPADQQFPKNRIITDQAAPFVVFGSTSPLWPEVSGLAGQNVSSIFDGTKTAEQVLKTGNARGNARLQQLLKEQHLSLFDWSKGIVVGLLLVAGLGAWVYLPERKIKRSPRAKREARIAYIFVFPWIAGLLIFTLGPMILSFLMSFADWDIIRPAHWRGLQNYVEAATVDPRFWVSLKVTLLFTVVAVPTGLALSLALALLLNAKVKGMPLYRTCYYLPSLASAVAASLIWRRMFQADGGIINSIIYGSDGHGNFLGLAHLLQPLATANGQINWLGNEKTALPSIAIMSLWGAGGGMVILLAGLQGVPQFYYEAAILDGAGAWQKFKSVTIPLISPTLFFSLVTGFIGAFQKFTEAFVMTEGGPNDSTMFYMLHLYNNAFLSLRMGYASALAWVLFFIVLAFTVAQLKLSKWVYYEAAG